MAVNTLDDRLEVDADIRGGETNYLSGFIDSFDLGIDFIIKGDEEDILAAALMA